MSIYDGLTSISQDEMHGIMREDMSFDAALRYMNERLQIRTFAETLDCFNRCGDDKKQRLTDSLFDIEASINPKANRDSISRNVRNWLGGRFTPDGRADMIKLCFALGLGDADANVFLSLTAEGGFHLRNPFELACAYALRTGRPYRDAVELYGGLKPLVTGNASSASAFTHTIADAFASVRDEQSFHAFYAEHYDALGTMHNTAYHKCFMPFLSTLICPGVPSFFEKERKYSVEEVVTTYLRMDVPLDKRTSRMSVLQRTIRKYWPNASSITKMRNREEDVTRKVLILLYLVTDGHSAADMAYEEDLSPAELFENHYWKLSAMLNDCGFSRLDPRGVFDWLILYCLRTAKDQYMNDRLAEVLHAVFEPETL